MPHGNYPINRRAATVKPFHRMVENLLFNAHISVYNLYITDVADLRLSFRLPRLSDVGCNNSAPLNSHKLYIAHPISKGRFNFQKRYIYFKSPPHWVSFKLPSLLLPEAKVEQLQDFSPHTPSSPFLQIFPAKAVADLAFCFLIPQIAPKRLSSSQLAKTTCISAKPAYLQKQSLPP